MAISIATTLVLLLLAFGPRACQGQDDDAETTTNNPDEESPAGDESPADGQSTTEGGCAVCPDCEVCLGTIPPGYKVYECKGYYKMHYEAKNWDDAKAACESEGGYLAVIDSPDELVVPMSFVRRFRFDHIFLGFFDKNKKGNYHTVLDEPMTYLAWAPGEPNNRGVENCGSFFKGAFNDMNCEVEAPFLCELYA